MMKIDKILENYTELDSSRKAELKEELLGLFSVSESNLYDTLANANNLIEIEIPNIWVKNEPKQKDDLFETTYMLTKLGFVVKLKRKPPKTEFRLPLFSWLFYSR